MMCTGREQRRQPLRDVRQCRRRIARWTPLAVLHMLHLPAPGGSLPALTHHTNDESCPLGSGLVGLVDVEAHDQQATKRP